MKNKLIVFLSIITLSTLFMGCPYSTELELDGALKVDAKYLGTYEKQSSSYYYLEVTKHSETEYKLENYRTESKVLRESGIGKLYVIGGAKFLVVKRESKSGYSSYNKKSYIYKFRPAKSGYMIKLQGVSDYIDEEFETAADLKKYIEKYKDISFFYQNKVEKYYRTDEEEEEE